MVTGMPMVWSLGDGVVNGHSLPILVGDLAQVWHIILLKPQITDKELIHTF